MSAAPSATSASPLARLPFFYGWVVVAVAFVTMAIGVNTRTAFSLLFPPILEEFGWSQAETVAAFSLGFLVSGAVSAVLGMAMDRFGPRWVVPFGATLVAAGMALATLATRPWHLYLTLGVLVVGGSVIFSYIGHSMFLPLWFVRRRGLAIGIAFSGVGVGSILLFPWLQYIIDVAGWRQASWALAALLMLVVFPLNLILQRHRPERYGLRPDGDPPAEAPAPDPALANPAQPPPPEVDWTLGRAVRSAPFWWLAVGFFCALVAWYMVQVHQTKYLVEIGFSAQTAAFALGLVGLTGIVGQIGLGYFSDRVGREWAWTLAALGFAACYALLLVMGTYPSPVLMYLMVASQGILGYGLASIFGAIPAEIFQGRSFATIFGVLAIPVTFGAAFGPWLAGVVKDFSGSYTPAFWVGMAVSLFSIACVWFAAPRKGPVR